MWGDPPSVCLCQCVCVSRVTDPSPRGEGGLSVGEVHVYILINDVTCICKCVHVSNISPIGKYSISMKRFISFRKEYYIIIYIISDF